MARKYYMAASDDAEMLLAKVDDDLRLVGARTGDRARLEVDHRVRADLVVTGQLHPFAVAFAGGEHLPVDLRHLRCRLRCRLHSSSLHPSPCKQ